MEETYPAKMTAGSWRKRVRMVLDPMHLTSHSSIYSVEPSGKSIKNSSFLCAIDALRLNNFIRAFHFVTANSDLFFSLYVIVYMQKQQQQQGQRQQQQQLLNNDERKKN